MEIAAALLAGGITFFAGFCFGLYPPVKPKASKNVSVCSSSPDRYFENFLNYNGDVQP